jgi:hypothetical protein
VFGDGIKGEPSVKDLLDLILLNSVLLNSVLLNAVLLNTYRKEQLKPQWRVQRRANSTSSNPSANLI